jgi:arabinan endo-1,5-alpha-L-arabinosidase
MNDRRRTAASLSAALVAVLALTLLPALSPSYGASAAPSERGAKQLGFKKAKDGRYARQVATRAPAAQRFRKEQRRQAKQAMHDRRAARQAVLGAQPILDYRGVADPTVVQWGPYWIAVSTGPGAPRAMATNPGGPWQNIPSALTTLPSWAISGRIWASDLVQVGGEWILYFSAEVAGLGIDGRCIGAAYASDPTQPFIPDEKPIVCPKKGAVAPKAYDPIKKRPKSMPQSGVIDPEFFKDKGGKQYLMYRTQSLPSSIRIVRLPRSGHPSGTKQSDELVRSNDVIENPTMLRKGRNYLLMTSEDYFGDCSYETTFRRSTKLLDWSKSHRQVLMNQAKTGLCGPGGADLGRGASGELLLYFHAWTCPGVGNCPSGYDYNRTSPYDARRALFAATLRFTKNKSPRISGYVAPILPPPPPPTESPTPTPTTAPPSVSTTPSPAVAASYVGLTSWAQGLAAARNA